MSGDMLQFPRSLNAAFKRPLGATPPLSPLAPCSCPGSALESGGDDLADRLYVSLLLTLSEKVIALEVEMQALRRQVKDLSHMVGP